MIGINDCELAMEHDQAIGKWIYQMIMYVSDHDNCIFKNKRSNI
jgi:hypothetical protein